MAQFTPPRPLDSPDSRYEEPMVPVGPAPMSGLAIAGFVSSIIFCCPVLSPLLGIILSLVGLAQTRGGSRRGRGLAIAGLVISLLVGIPAQLFGGWWGKNYIGDQMRLFTQVMTVDFGKIDGLAGTAYELGSPNFKSKTTQDELAKWLKTRFESLGGLQNIQVDQLGTQKVRPNGRIPFTFQSQFVNKKVSWVFEVAIDMASGHWMLENIRLDEQSIIEESPGSALLSNENSNMTEGEPASTGQPSAQDNEQPSE